MPLINVNSVVKGGSLEEKVNNNRAVLVYHWNSCGHCRTFMPLLHKVMEMNRELNKANVFEIEYSNFNFLPNFLRNVNAFPYMVAYKNGSIAEEFNDQRTIPKIEAFISRHSAVPLVSALSSSLSSSLSSASSKRKMKKRRVLKSYNSKSKSN